jgi:PIN domain nuclease of toxin-antitoxin system
VPASCIRLPAGFSAWCDALDAVDGIRIEPLVLGDVEHARTLRRLVDPHDRLIGGTAARLNVPLMTADPRIRGEPRVRTLW